MNNQIDGLSPLQKRQMIAYEGFLRRASVSGLPFMLKGSFVTRQYLPAYVGRLVNDLDWLYLVPVDEPDELKRLLESWISGITDQELDDGVRFESFFQNGYWDSIDYAMGVDFPTVRTEINCWVNAEPVKLSIDVSFNLPVDDPPVPMFYQPLRGDPFIIEKTAPLALQVAWKIHQCIQAPRIKDLFDLTYLVEHSSFNPKLLEQIIQSLVHECQTSHIPVQYLRSFFNYDAEKLSWGMPYRQLWHEFVQHPPTTNMLLLAVPFEVFFRLFKKAMLDAGFDPRQKDFMRLDVLDSKLRP